MLLVVAFDGILLLWLVVLLGASLVGVGVTGCGVVDHIRSSQFRSESVSLSLRTYKMEQPISVTSTALAGGQFELNLVLEGDEQVYKVLRSKIAYLF